jgi:SPP1 gp7 family putative phage head morphogenesis protein
MTTFDAYVRHQVYVEGYKNGQAQDAETLYEEITAAIIISLNRLNVNNMGELTKAKLAELTRLVKQKMVTLFRKQVELTMADIKRFMNNDFSIMAQLTSAVVTEKVPSNVLDREKGWKAIENTPIAGVGLTPAEAMTAAETAGIAAIVQLLRRAWADNMDMAELMRVLVGTLAMKRKDGIISRQRRAFATAIETVIQHVTTEVQFRIGQFTSTHYVWCSILDSRTTEICRSRNGHAYEYGRGPRPPAHWNCRSFTIPATIVNVADIPTFYTWVKRQPAGVQDDVLGPARGRDLRDGKIKSDELPGFDRARPLTVNEYGDSVRKIISEVA